MSTRVQKGGAVFKPVLKSRARLQASASRQVSNAPADIEHVGLEAVFAGNPANATPDTTAVTTPQNSQSPQPLQPPPGAEPSEKKNQRKSSGDESRKGKRRAPSLPPFDPAADPGEDLDETAVLMGDLCSDTGHGRVSSKAAQIRNNHTAWRTANREKRAKMKGLMELRKYGKPDDETVPLPAGVDSHIPGSTGAQQTAEAGPSSGARATNGADSSAPNPSSHGFDYSQTMATSRFNVQVRTGPSGEIIVDEDSLYVNRNQEATTEGYTHVEESDTTKFVNSATYGKKYRGSRWSTEETELFYDALSQFGENYELISYVLPGRDRTACKNKFKSEDKKNPEKINYYLNHRTPYDIQTLSRMTGKDFSGPTPEIKAPTPSMSVENPADPPS